MEEKSLCFYFHFSCSYANQGSYFQVQGGEHKIEFSL